jgi:hypothetical protein
LGSWLLAVEKCIDNKTYEHPQLPFSLNREAFSYEGYKINEEYLVARGYDMRLLIQYIEQTRKDDYRTKAARLVDDIRAFIYEHCGKFDEFDMFIAKIRLGYSNKYEGCITKEQKKSRELDF